MQPGAHEVFISEVKILSSDTPEGLTEKVNLFLFRNEAIQIKDVKLSTCTAQGEAVIYTALILI